MFDTLTYANKLKEAGFTERQAQAQAEALVAVVDSNLATKQDIELLRHDTKQDIELLRQDTKQNIELLRHDTKQDIELLRQDTKQNIELLRHDTKLEMGLIRRDMKEMELKFEGQFLLLKWMLGFILAGMLSLILKSFFTH